VGQNIHLLPRQVLPPPPRSANNVKNRFYALGRKSFRRMCKFTGTIAKRLNAQSIKPTTFSRIFVPECANEVGLGQEPSLHNLGREDLNVISHYLLEFMDDKGKNFHTLRDKFSVSEVKHAIGVIFSLK
jgi:hypothetical protein